VPFLWQIYGTRPCRNLEDPSTFDPSILGRLGRLTLCLFTLGLLTLCLFTLGPLILGPLILGPLILGPLTFEDPAARKEPSTLDRFALDIPKRLVILHM
jgi:hypothetical protein